MKNEPKHIRLTTIHFCILFILFCTVLYGITLAENSRINKDTLSSLTEIADVPISIPDNGLSFVLFYEQDIPAGLQMERNLSRLSSSEGVEAMCCKINGSVHEEICMQHSISGFPSILIFKDGIEVNRVLGVTSYRNLCHIYKKVK